MIRPESLFPLLVVLSSAVLAVVTFRRGSGSPTSRLYGWLNFFIGFFAFGSFARINAHAWSTHLPGGYAWEYAAGLVSQAGDAVVPVWIMFAAAYAGHQAYTRGWRMVLLWVPFTVNLALAATEPLHHRFLGEASGWPQSMGPWFPAYFIVTSLFILFGQSFFFRLAWAIQEPRLRRQAWTMAVASLVPFLVGAFYYLGPDEIFGVMWKITDFCTLSFLFTDLAFFYILFRLDFLDHMPMALLEVFDAIADPIVLVNHHIRVSRMNAAARTWFPELQVGSSLPGQFPQWTLGMVENLGRSAPLPENLSWRGRIFRCQMVSTRRQAESHLTALVFTDITNLVKARENAFAANHSQTRFLMKVSHQMRNPLQGIIGFNEILADRLTGESQALAARSLEQSRRLLAQINNLIDFSRSLKDPEPPDIKPVDLKELLLDMNASISERLKGRDVQASVYLDPIIPARVLADARRLRQVLLHLLDNAQKFTAKGLISLEVRQLHLNGDRLDLQFSVSDSGRGMTVLERERAFDAYTQFELHADESRGHGLGLPLCRELVKQMGGELTLESRPEMGTRAEFMLTLGTDVVLPGVIPPRDPNQALRILVAEDQPMNRELLEILLTGWGCQVDSAENGRKAFEIFTGKPFDLVILDVQMPEMNGFEVARAIRSLPDPRSRVPLLALTGHAYADRGEGDARLMDDWLIKPVPSLDLQAAVWKWTGRGDPTTSKGGA